MSNPAAQAVSRLKGFKLASLGWFGGLMGREMQSHRVSFVWVPMILAGFMIFGFISSAIIGNSLIQELGVLDEIQGGRIVIDGHEENVEDATFLLERLNNMDIEALDRALGIGVLFTLMLPFFFLVVPLLILFGLLGSLYDDRRDRSYLFWKSMPVSDTTEVLSKLFAITIMGPAIVIAFAALTQVVWMIVASLQGMAYDLPVGTFLFNQVPTFSLWFGMLGMVVLAVVWALPIIGWLTFVSSVAKKAPLLVALVPIGAITALEAVFFKSTVFIKWIVDRLVGWFVTLDGYDFEHLEEPSPDFSSPFIGGVIDRFGEIALMGEFWASTAVGVALIYGAIYMRRYNV